MKRLRRHCPICNSGSGEVLHCQAFELPEDHPLADGYEVVCCDGCGFCFADIAAVQADYDRYYERLSKYADATNASGSGTTPWDQARLHGVASAIANFEPNRTQRILDIGCASGGLLNSLTAAGFTNLCGIDPSLSCVNNANSAHLQALQGSLFHLPSNVGCFEGIVLSHVLEHVRDIKPALQGLEPVLNPEGWIYIEVPDASRYKDYIFAPFQDFNTEHINHFSAASLENFLSQSGFQTVAGGEKEILSAPGRPYPAVFAFARRSTKKNRIEPDGMLRTAIVEYIERSNAKLGVVRNRIQQLVDRGTRLAVWGTGQLTTKLLVETALKNANITAFIDSNPVNRGTPLHGVAVSAPEDFNDDNATIVVGSMISTESILKDILRLGLKNPVVTLDSE